MNMDHNARQSSFPPAPWSRGVKLAVSVAVSIHLAAVFIAPMSFAVRPGSPAIDPLRAKLLPYIQAMFLDHGYAFFAPDPGPSHLVEYHLEYADARPAQTARFPNLREHQPRLLYHRHFMLSESLQTLHVPAEAPRLPASMDAEERSRELNDWREARDRYEALRDSFARHLAHAHGADQVVVHRLRHDFLPPSQFTGEFDPSGPRKMDDPRTYVDLDQEQEELPQQRDAFLPGITPLPRGGE